ncbi:MAG: hypothetical protein VB858_19805 [Planctomycetaceae bacterium]
MSARRFRGGGGAGAKLRGIPLFDLDMQTEPACKDLECLPSLTGHLTRTAHAFSNFPRRELPFPGCSHPGLNPFSSAGSSASVRPGTIGASMTWVGTCAAINSRSVRRGASGELLHDSSV